MKLILNCFMHLKMLKSSILSIHIILAVVDLFPFLLLYFVFHKVSWERWEENNMAILPFAGESNKYVLSTDFGKAS